MKRYVDVEGDRWVATIDRQAAHEGMHAVVFHCVTDSQRPWRVVEVPARNEREDRGAADFSEGELRELFGNAQIMDFTRDQSSEPERHGDGRWRLT